MKNLIQSAREVFSRPSYILIALLSGILIGFLMIWLSNYELISFVLTSELFSGMARAKLIVLSLGSFVTNFGLISQITIILISLLAGVNIAMLSFYLKKRVLVKGAAGTGIGGVLIGTLGVGCSTCGSIFLSSLIGITSASVLISYLPFGGAEFSLFGISLILFSIYTLGEKIQSATSCVSKKN